MQIIFEKTKIKNKIYKKLNLIIFFSVYNTTIKIKKITENIVIFRILSSTSDTFLILLCVYLFICFIVVIIQKINKLRIIRILNLSRT